MKHVEISRPGESGVSAIFNKDGSIICNLGIIASVGIKNIADVSEHHVNTILESRSHMVRFVNGGVLTYSYNKAGVLIELKMTDLLSSISKNNEVMISVNHDTS